MKKFLLLLLLAGTTVLAQGTMKFSGKITNPNSDKITISGGEFKRVINVAKDGTFRDQFDVPEGIYSFFDGEEYTSLFLKNGFDLYMALDTKEFDESIKYTGKGAAENNVLAEKALEDEKLSGQVAALQSDQQAMIKLIQRHNAYVHNKLTAPGLDPGLKRAYDADSKRRVAEQKKAREAMKLQKAKNLEMIGKPSPSFVYENHKGGKTKLEDLRGKFVYIDMWATWCAPCIAEIPALKKIEERYHGKNIEFVSISIDAAKDYEKWKKFVTNRNLGGVQLFADKDWKSEFATAYGVQSIPRFILIDPKGNVVDADAPRPSDPALVAKLDSLLK